MKRNSLFIILLLSIPFIIFAQQQPKAVLEYFEDPDEIEIIGANGKPLYDVYEGMDLAIGSTIKTNGTVAELRLMPNKTIIKLSSKTVFKIQSLQGSNSQANEFQLLSGKLRTIAAKSGKGDNYSIQTPSAVCGVRGTDFGQEYIEGFRDAVAVLSGAVEFTSLKLGRSISLTKGMAADAMSDAFQAFVLPPDQLAELFKGMDFKKLNPLEVPGHAEETGQVAEETAEEGEEKPTEAEVTEETSRPATEEEVAKAQEQVESALAKKIREILGMEIGTVTIDGTTYSKAIIQPTFNLGKLKLALYLPIIYSTDMFDPDDWYKPGGNDEWSFGTDQEEPIDIAADIMADLFLKIRYVKWGEQFDPFYLKAGNLNDMSIGHGILMYNYANDADFPSVRKVGLNMGIQGESFGFEAVVNDLAEPDIIGGRMRFGRRLGFAVSGVTDLNPAKELAGEKYGDPIFINGAVDIDFPIIQKSFILFADVGAMMPYYREAYSTLEPGFYYQAVYNDEIDLSFDSFRNYGAAAGGFGRILGIDWRLEWRYYNGTFRPAFYNTGYDRLRGELVKKIAEELTTETDPTYTMGVYGRGAFTVKKLFSFDLSYFWPWTFTDDGGIDPADEDELSFRFVLFPDAIPVLKIHGSLSYTRVKFIPTLLQEGTGSGMSLFDGNTVVKGEIIYPVAPTLDLAAIITTAAKRNPDGTTKLDSNGSPEVYPSLSIETRLHF